MIGPLKTALLLSYICIASISAAIITPALPAIESGYSLSHGALEWVVSIFLLGYVFGQLIYGPIANRYGRLLALRSGLIVNLIGIILCILTIEFHNYWLLLLGRLITALGASCGLCCTFMLINELLPPDRAKHAMAFAIVSFTVGIGLAVSLGGLITQYSDWPNCFWLLLAHGLIMLAFTWQFPETLKQPAALHPRAIVKAYYHALKNTRLLVFSLVVGTLSAFGYCYSAAAPLYAQTTLQLSASEYGTWNLINMLGMLGSGFLGAYLIKRYSEKTVLLLGFILLTPTLVSLLILAFSTTGNTVWFFVNTMLLYLFYGLLFPAASFFASNAIDDTANASSAMSFINMGSATLCVIIMGYLPYRPIISLSVLLAVFFVLTTGLALWQFSKLCYTPDQTTGEKQHEVDKI